MTQKILAWATSILTTTPIRWMNLVQSVSEELLQIKPAPGEWSAVECLQHLVETERFVMPVRVKALLAGQSFPGFNPSDNGTELPSAAALVEEFTRLRHDNLPLLAQVTEKDLDKQAFHAEYGMVTMSQFLHHWAGHDLMHTVQAERALLQPFIQGCGPWEMNYTDHLARKSQV